uniref:Uncharacterized protein n=1 Tax=Vespula pensylvanica TaxID=30213 RepID=A0A834NS47_VESPE|nr:hypothetical protein H0235_011568 [Vespula pensylvanica]
MILEETCFPLVMIKITPLVAKSSHGAFGDALLRTEGAPTLGEMLGAVSKDRKCGASDAGCGGGSCDAVVYRGVSSEGAVE